MASQLELAQDFLQVRRTQLTGSTRRLAAGGEPDQLFAGGFVLVAFSHLRVAAAKNSAIIEPKFHPTFCLGIKGGVEHMIYSASSSQLTQAVLP
jgi:hypothetical protein